MSSAALVILSQLIATFSVDDECLSILNHLQHVFPIRLPSDVRGRRAKRRYGYRGSVRGRGSAYDYSTKILIENSQNIESLIDIFKSTQNNHLKFRCLEIFEKMMPYQDTLRKSIRNAMKSCLSSLIWLLSQNNTRKKNVIIIRALQEILLDGKYVFNAYNVELLRNKLYNIYNDIIDEYNQDNGVIEEDLLLDIEYIYYQILKDPTESNQILEFHEMKLNLSFIPIHLLDDWYISYYQQLLDTNSLPIRTGQYLIESNFIVKLLDYLVYVSEIDSIQWDNDKQCHVYHTDHNDEYKFRSETYSKVVRLLKSLYNYKNTDIQKIIRVNVFDGLDVIEPYGNDYTFCQWSIDEELVYKIMNKNNIQYLINCSILQKTAEKAVVLIFNKELDVGMYEIKKCVSKAISLMKEQHLSQFDDIDKMILNHMINYDKQIIDKLVSTVFISDNQQRKIQIYRELEYDTYLGSSNLNKSIIDQYIEFVINFQYKAIMQDNEMLCYGYCRQMDEYLYFVDNLKYFVVKYFGNYNNLHIFGDSVVNYKGKECVVIKRDEDEYDNMVTINIDNKTENVKLFQLQRITLNASNLNLYKFVKIMFTQNKYDDKYGEIKAIRNEKFAQIQITNSTLFILLHFLFPIKLS